MSYLHQQMQVIYRMPVHKQKVINLRINYFFIFYNFVKIKNNSLLQQILYIKNNIDIEEDDKNNLL